MTSLSRRLRYLLLQVRNPDDPVRQQEVRCFARALDCDEPHIRVFDLIRGAPSPAQLGRFDVVLLGGSGDYSVAEGGSWLPAALEAMYELYTASKPTFASCWGFQAMAKAMGGEVVTDLDRAELGSVLVRLTPAGKQDPIFGGLGDQFLAAMGHQDVVARLPSDAVLLASSEAVSNQAFRFADKPIYCTQFHPELDRDTFLERVRAYPQYVERIAGVSMEEFSRVQCLETPIPARILTAFLQHYFGSAP